VHGNADWVLVDATPDMVAQIQDVGSMPKAILLTHAHMGHYIGLAQLGREAMSANNMNVWCSESMASYLKNNGPWSQLVELNNIKLNIFSPNEPFEIIKGVKTIAHPVPHRKEFSDTHAFELEVNNQKALYVPDIDSWEEWPEFLNIAEQQDFLLIDATFYDNNELGNRDMSQIPHPRVTESMDLLEPIVKSSDIQVYFIHINHTNPILDKSSNAYKEVKMRGFNVSKKNDVLRK
jgi:pyrroloquinoline quinone biosynthesis protein B